jgi:hypothetical protein
VTSADINIGPHFWSVEHFGEHARHAPAKGTALAPQAVTATVDLNTYASLPTPLTAPLTMVSGPWVALFLLSAYVDIGANNVEVALALDVSGATTVVAGANPEDRLHVQAKSPVAATLSLADYGVINQGDHVLELKYVASGAATVSDVALSVLPLGHVIP